MQLRDYQAKMRDEALEAWQRHQNVLCVAPTGSGKTVIKAALLQSVNVPSIALAHRQELVSQLSTALAVTGVPHRVIAPNPVMQFCVAQHIKRTGQSWVDPAASVLCGSVQTVTSREAMHPLVRQCRVWDIDEAHHVLMNNMWGRCLDLLGNARGIGFTATPFRADKKGLGRGGVWRGGAGVFDYMVLGPSTDDLISQGYLSQYRIIGPPPSIDTSDVRVSRATGDYNRDDLRHAAHVSRIVGDVVQSYLARAPGKRGITFAVDVKQAQDIAAAYNGAGVPAVALDAKTDDTIRQQAVDRLRAGDLKQIVNVDLFGEGTDCPDLEVVSMARPTQSLPLYLQQFGRVMRPVPGKDYGLVIDHVNNVMTHGLPDTIREYSLEGTAPRPRDPDDVTAIKTCEECFGVYHAYLKLCPHCGHKPVPVERSRPQAVDGDLFEYGPELLAQLRGEIDRVDSAPMMPRDAPDYVRKGIMNKWHDRQAAQHELRTAIEFWAGMMKHGHGCDDGEIYRRFYFRFGIDVATAQTLDRKSAAALTERIRGQIT